jgi:RNA polymerase sigma-70 factor (ECF subfamily)
MTSSLRSLTSEEGWRHLVEEQWPRVTSQAYRACGDQSLAEDIAQEVFLKVFRNLSQHRPDVPIGHWIARITSTTTVDALRRRHPEVSLDSEDTIAPPSSTGDPLAAVERDETRRLMRVALLRLPEPLREVLWLTAYAGLTHAEVGAALGIPVRTVVTRVMTARVHLRHALARYQREAA